MKNLILVVLLLGGIFYNGTTVREYYYDSEVVCLEEVNDSLRAQLERMQDTMTQTLILSPRKDAVVRSRFGMRFHPILKIWRPHNGLDLLGSNDTIYAAKSGIVYKDTVSSSYGNVLKIKGKDSLHYIYAHLEKSLVDKADSVKAGEPIGLEGNTGLSVKDHLHFEIRDKNYIPIDPVRYKIYDLSDNEPIKPNQ